MSETIANSPYARTSDGSPSISRSNSSQSQAVSNQSQNGKPSTIKPTSRRILGSPFKSPNKISTFVPFNGSDIEESLHGSPTGKKALEAKSRHENPSMVGGQRETSIENVEMSCPICNEEMIKLSQLNQHLDDMHNNVNAVNNDDLTAWFKKKYSDAKKLQNNVMQQQKKFVKLDIFDNSAFSFSDNSESGSSSEFSEQNNSLQNRLANPVTRKHWHKPAGFNNEICSQVDCSKRLNIKNGTVNCRKCGKLFCNAHTYYRIRLSSDAEYDCNGLWCRCCEACFVNKPGFKDGSGFAQDLTSNFKAIRQNKVDDELFKLNRLEKRFIKLIHIIVQYETDGQNFFSKFNSSKKLQALEQTVVSWERDSDVLNCFICLQMFGYTLRKHHCRLCGKIVCENIETGCSMDVPAKLLVKKLDNLNYSSLVQEHADQLKEIVKVRICRNCKDTLFRKRNFKKSLDNSSNLILSLYEQMSSIKYVISILLPKLENEIMKIESIDPSKENLEEITKIKNKLMNSFQQYDQLSKRLNLLPIQGNGEKQLQSNIYNSSVLFIHEKMTPLKALPKLLKETQDRINSTVSSSTLVSESEDSLKSPPPNEPTSVVPPGAPKPKLMKREVRELREQLMVMQEQSFLVNEMIENAKSQRKFDEVQTLEFNLKDLEIIIQNIRIKLGEEGF